nr:AMP-binding protein [Micromonospora tarapacensis]
MTYRQFADGADGVAAMLAHRGVGKGDAVAYLGENSPEFLQVMFGTAALGAVFVPVNTRLAPPEIAHILADCGARVLVHDPEFGPRVAAVLGAAPGLDAIATGEGTADDPGLARLLRPPAAAPPPPPSPSMTRPRSSTPRAPPAGPRAPC